MKKSPASKVPDPVVTHGKTLSPARSTGESAVRKRLEALSSETRETLLDLEIMAASCPEGRRLLWLEDGAHLVSNLLDTLETALRPRILDFRAEVAPAKSSIFRESAVAFEHPDFWDDHGSVLVEARQLLTGLRDGLQRALAKQPRITGGVRSRLQDCSRDLTGHVLDADRALEAGLPCFTL